MKHNFKPGDRAYWLARNRWVELEKAADCNPDEYVIQVKGHGFSFTSDGKEFLNDETVVLLPVNPYDPSDPNNPPEFKSEWPFMLRGRRLEVGMEMRGIFDNGTLPVRIKSLELLESNYCVICSWDGGTQVGVIHPNNLRFPDEVVTKKKVAKWAYPIIGIPGIITVGFTEEMTLGEARKKFGSFVKMIPETEREVEG